MCVVIGLTLSCLLKINMVSFTDPVLEAKAGISVKPENPKEIVDAILKLYKMPESKRNELGQNGRVFVEKYHSYEQLAKQYEYLFN